MYHSLPTDYAKAQPILQRALRESASSVLPMVSSRRRPDPPRNLISQPGTGLALITWNPPFRDSDVAGWKVYKDSESNLYGTITDPKTFQMEVSLPANSSTFIYVSSFNASGRESIKVQVKASSDSNQYATAGSGVNGSIPGLPPGYSSEILQYYLRLYGYYY